MNGGVSYARNCGIDLASGDYITFIDDDDYVSACYLEEMLSAVSPNEVAICDSLSFVDGSSSYDESYVIHKSFLQLKRYNKTLNENDVKKYLQGPCRSLIHRDIIGERRFDEKFKNGEDSLFMFLISDRFSTFNLSKDTAVYYRRLRIGSASSSQNRKDKLLNAIRLIQAYIGIYIKRPQKYNLQFFITRVLGALHSICGQ